MLRRPVRLATNGQGDKGIGSEAVRVMLRFDFEQMNLNRIYAGTIADNYEAVRLLEKVGF